MRHAKRLSIAMLFVVLASVGARAQTSIEHAAARIPGAAVDETQTVQVPPPSEKALQYYRSGNVLWVVDQVWGFALPLAILATGLSWRLRGLAQRIGRKWFFTLAIYIILFNVLTSVVDLPRAYYEEFARQHAYGLSNQTFRKWLTDTATALAVGCIIGPLVVWVPYLLLRKSPRRWWLYSALALVPFLIAGNLIAPIWIAPLLNKVEPMRDKALETKILALADRAGIEGGRVFEVNKSVDTKTINAYVAGVLNTKRIVLWDTILQRMNE